MSVDPRRGGVLCGDDPRCYRECRCSRWPDYVNRFGNYVVPHDEDETTYIDKVLSYSPILYYPMNETAGLTADNLGSLGAAADGTYTGVTLADALGPDGVNGAPFFDGANDYLNAMTAALVNAWDAGGAEWTVMAWWRVFNVGVWTDAALRMVVNAYDTANDLLQVAKNVAVNQFYDGYWVGGSVAQSNISAGTPTTWQCTTVTRSEAAGEVIYYRNGAWVATDGPAIGVWASATPWTRIVIGAGSVAPIQVWHGWLGHVAMWNSALGAPAILDLATPTP